MKELIQSRWAEIDALLEQLIDLPPDARSTWLATHCADPDLRAAVSSLVSEASDDGQLERVRAAVQTDDLPLSRQIGEYRLLRQIGAGGMATVYLAERTLPNSTQRVALKLMRVGLYEPTQKALFRREQQILARLEHAGIARLIDAGLTTADVPYLVMEYIDGRPLDRYCDASALNLRRRLQLFVQVCDAVAYAHRNLVVHRDLKPSNILVCADGTLKLLDFGIAKLLDDKTEATRTEHRQLTPGYAAPEQSSGGPINTATDVFALGVILNMLLTGKRPEYHGDASLRLPSSQVVTQPLGLAAQRGNSTRHLRSQLRGDLDCIVAHALQRESTERYADAAELRADIQRHLDGLPVLARPEAWGYRASRFLKRHRYASAASAIALAALIAATAISVYQTKQALLAAQRAEAQAQRELRIKNFLIDLFESVNPYRGVETTQLGSQLTAVQLLEQAVAALDKDLNDAPQAQAELGVALARSLYRLGATGDARKAIDVAAQRLRGTADYPAKDLAKALILQAQIHENSGDTVGAERLVRESLALIENIPHEALERIAAKTTLASLVNLREARAEGSRLHQEILAERIALVGPVHVDVAMDLSNIAVDYLNLERYADAERSVREAQAMLTKLLGGEHMRVVWIRNVVAAIYLRRGRYVEAEGELDWVQSMQRRMLKPSHLAIASTAAQQAVLYFNTGRYSAAEQALTEARAILAPLRHHQLSANTRWFGKLALARGQFKEARAQFEAAQREVIGDNSYLDPYALSARAGAGFAAAMDGDYAAGLAELHAAIAAMEAIEFGAAEELGEAYAWLAEVHLQRREKSSAELAAKESLRIYFDLGGAEHPSTQTGRKLLAKVETLP